MTFKGIFIDDNPTEAAYADLLSSPGSLHVSSEKLQEVATLATVIFGQKPDLVALDFRLDELLGTLVSRQGYKGSGLAQLLRDKSSADPASDFPIILLSAEDKIKGYQKDNTAHDLFDRYYIKSEVNSEPSRVQREVVALCRGYKTLKDNWGQLNAGSLLGITNDDAEMVLSQEITSSVYSASAPHVVARFVLRNLIDRSGLLMSISDIAALLGLASAAEVAKLEEHFPRNTRYNGLFSDGWPRWWRHYLEAWVEDLFSSRPLRLTGAERVERFNQQLNVQLVPAKSRWNQSSQERFAVACACCGQPTELRHSVLQFDPYVPRFAQPGRICWYCIHTDAYLHPLRSGKPLIIDQTDMSLAEMVKGMECGSGDEDEC
ncbi:hypothetical protein GAY31_22675 [Azospirillum brasilense]|nr:hypothetical protein [Azospirillum brasilense]